MGILAPSTGERVRDVRIDADTLSVAPMDGRAISVPLAWFLRLLDATPAQRARWGPAGAGYGIHWPDLDEDLSTEGLLPRTGGTGPSGGLGVPRTVSPPSHLYPVIVFRIVLYFR